MEYRISQLLPKRSPAFPDERPDQVSLDDIDAHMAMWAGRGYTLVSHQIVVITLGFDPGKYFAYSFVWSRDAPAPADG